MGLGETRPVPHLEHRSKRCRNVLAVLAACLVLATCDPSRDIVVVNNSHQTLVANVLGFEAGESLTISWPAQSSVTLAQYGAGGNEPFFVKTFTIFDAKCTALTSISVSDYQMDGGTITIGSDLRVEAQSGGRPQEAASAAPATACRPTQSAAP